MLEKIHAELGIPVDYAARRGLPAFPDASQLVDIGPNLVGRTQQLTPVSAERWQAMVSAAAADGVMLLLVSGFRSVTYQAALIAKKIAAGQSIADILSVNAAPGYSEHHTGCAVDIATPGSRPLTEAFETSDAYRWLAEHAHEYGFSLTYPRDNPWGMIYEPWHWSVKA